MSDSDAGWLVAGTGLLAGVAALIRTMRPDPNKVIESAVEDRRLDLAADEQEAQQAERAADALMELLRETREMLREERETRREWQQAAVALQSSNLALRDEVAALRAEVHSLRAEVADKIALRRELDETKQILATYRARDKEQ